VAVVLVSAVFTVRGFLTSQRCLARAQPLVEVGPGQPAPDKVEFLGGCAPADIG
jgi:hypothetical protein